MGRNNGDLSNQSKPYEQQERNTSTAIHVGNQRTTTHTTGNQKLIQTKAKEEKPRLHTTRPARSNHSHWNKNIPHLKNL